MADFLPFDMQLIIDRIREAGPKLQMLGGAADFAAVENIRGFRSPSAFVIAAEESPGDISMRHAGGSTHAEVYFGIAIAVTNFGDIRGGKTTGEARQTIGGIRSALLGWTPPALPGARPVEWRGGMVLEYSQSILLWADKFKTQHFLQR